MSEERTRMRKGEARRREERRDAEGRVGWFGCRGSADAAQTGEDGDEAAT